MKTNKLTRIIFTFILLGAIVLLGFLKEHIFYDIATQLTLYPDLDLYLNGYSRFNHASLYVLKWFFTLGFTIAYALISSLTIYMIYTKVSYVYLVLKIYAIIIAVAAIFYTIGILTNYSVAGYVLAQHFMSILQSPILIMVLIPAVRISRYFTDVDRTEKQYV